MLWDVLLHHSLLKLSNLEFAVFGLPLEVEEVAAAGVVQLEALADVQLELLVFAQQLRVKLLVVQVDRVQRHQLRLALLNQLQQAVTESVFQWRMCLKQDSQ